MSLYQVPASNNKQEDLAQQETVLLCHLRLCQGTSVEMLEEGKVGLSTHMVGL